VCRVDESIRLAAKPGVGSGAGRVFFRTLVLPLTLCVSLAAELSSPAAFTTNSLPLLTNLQQVLDLGLDGVRQRRHPVDVTGVVTQPPGGTFWSRGGTTACLVVLTNRPPGLAVGQQVRVRGVASPAMLAPCIDFPHVEVLGPGAFPTPIRPSPGSRRSSSMAVGSRSKGSCATCSSKVF